MNKIERFETGRHARRLTEQAAAWYIEQQDHPSSRRRAKFLFWLHASPAHIAEYLAIAQLHGDLKAATSTEAMPVHELVARADNQNAVVMFPKIAADTAHQHRRHQPRRQPGPRMLTCTVAVAVAVAAAMTSVVLGVLPWRTTSNNLHQDFAANTEAIREVRLPDGSLIQLARGSMIHVRFDARYRQIDVIRGNALFEVGKDPTRPMFVSVGGHVLQDIGTVFDVRRNAADDTLTVISGRVRVWDVAHDGVAKIKAGIGNSQTSKGTVADLTAGDQIQLTPASTGLVHKARVEQTTAWLPANIRFKRETVSVVAQRFNAYTSTPLVIEDVRTGDMRITGLFHTKNPQAFIAYLATLPGVRIIYAKDSVRVVARSNAGHEKGGAR